MHVLTKEEFLEAINNASKEQLVAIIVIWTENQEIGVFAMDDAVQMLKDGSKE